MKRTILLLLVGCILVTSTSCGWIFRNGFTTTPSEHRGDIVVWVLILDILGLGIPVVVDLITGGLYEDKRPAAPMAPSDESRVIPVTTLLKTQLCLGIVR